MFVFGVNLPVAEVLFVVLLLFIVALVFIIIQLGKMSRHVRVLDETTLEIRRYEEAEEVTLRALDNKNQRLTPAEKKRVQTLADATAKAEKRALRMLLNGSEPGEVRNALLAAGVYEHLATRAVNDASYWLDRYVVLESAEAKRVGESMKSAAKK